MSLTNFGKHTAAKAASKRRRQIRIDRTTLKVDETRLVDMNPACAGSTSARSANSFGCR